MGPSKLRPWMLLVASTAVSLAFGEVVCRLALPRPGFVPFVAAEMHGVVQPDPVRGYRYASHFSRSIETPNYQIRFETNALGMRDVELESVPPERRRWLAVGDSYTQGHGVQGEESWPKRLEARLPGVHVFNAGVSAYGLDQMRKTANVLFPLIRPELILVGVYGNGYTRIADPYVVVGDGDGLMVRSFATSPGVEVTREGYALAVFGREPARRVSLWLDRHWQLVGHLLHLALGPRTLGFDRPKLPGALPAPGVLERAMQPMLDELAGLDRDAQRLGVPLVALVIGPVDNEGRVPAIAHRYHEIIDRFVRERGLCAVDALPALEASGLGPKLRLRDDLHWSAAAHELGAQALHAALERAASDEGTDDPCAGAAALLRVPANGSHRAP